MGSSAIAQSLDWGQLTEPATDQPEDNIRQAVPERTDENALTPDIDEADMMPPPIEMDEAIILRRISLRALNKVTARTTHLDVTVGSAVRFGNIEVVARTCWKSPPEQRPENAALLDIWEHIPGEAPERVFIGWMFSSSPSLSALEHPVYDITVVGCRYDEVRSEDT